MIALSHPTGNQNVRQALQALQELDKLESFHTTVGLTEGSALARGPLAKRTYNLPADKIIIHPWKEAMRLMAQKLSVGSLTRHETGAFSVDAVYQSLDAAVAQALTQAGDKLKGLYAYEDGALVSFKVARKKGIHCFYELPIAYGPFAQEILQAEAERLPEWEPTLVGTRDSQEKMERKAEELTLADTLICPSPFVAHSIPDSLKANITTHIIPYGAVTQKTNQRKTKDAKAPLRLLFVGSLTQRKGLADLLQAMHQIDPQKAELHVMGSLIEDLAFYQKAYPHFHYYPPAAHSKVLELMQTCDVFILPSLVEGRALVQLEALSCGLPLIITPNTGGDDLIESGSTGFIVPIRAPEAIADKIHWFIQNREQLPTMQAAAQAKAAETSWDHYRQQLKTALLPRL